MLPGFLWEAAGQSVPAVQQHENQKESFRSDMWILLYVCEWSTTTTTNSGSSSSSRAIMQTTIPFFYWFSVAGCRSYAPFAHDGSCRYWRSWQTDRQTDSCSLRVCIWFVRQELMIYPDHGHDKRHRNHTAAVLKCQMSTRTCMSIAFRFILLLLSCPLLLY